MNMVPKDKRPLTLTHPEHAKEAHNWDPAQITCGSTQKLEWKCANGHLWNQIVREKVERGNGTCPTCRGRKLLPGFNDLATTHPELKNEASGFDPTKVLASSTKKVSWRCELGHEWLMTPNARTRQGQKYPYCSNHRLLRGFNDLRTKFPEIASEAEGWDPTTVLYGSHSKRKWKCKAGHVWVTQISVRTLRGTSCNVCNGRLVSPGENDLATTHPLLAYQADGWDPSTVIAGSAKRKAWKCNKGHQWEAVVQSRAVLGRGCPYCSNNKVLAGFNDLATTHPELVKSAVNTNLTEVSAGSEKLIEWICELGHRWKSSPKKRIGRNYGCPYCSNSRLLKGFNDFATKNPHLADEAFGWDPTSVISGSAVYREWKCAKGHFWRTRVSVRDLGIGCPSCHLGGFDPNKDGYLYFLQHPTWQMFQIGITNLPDDRLKSHQKLGWVLLEIRGPIDGHLTQQLETTILRMLKSKGADLANEKITGKFDGYSEAWSMSTFEVKSIKELMRSVDDFEAKKKQSRNGA
jgi:hypothetical protein